MKSLLTFKNTTRDKLVVNDNLENLSRGRSEYILTAVALTGVLMPWQKNLSPNLNSEYKLVRPSGLEYYLVVNDEWHHLLSRFCYEEVKIVGLLNAANLTLIPQRVFPKGPKGEKENVIDLARRNSRAAAKSITKKINEFVLTPAVALAAAGADALI